MSFPLLLYFYILPLCYSGCSTLVYIHTAYRIMAHGRAETANPSTCC